MEWPVHGRLRNREAYAALGPLLLKGNVKKENKRKERAYTSRTLF